MAQYGSHTQQTIGYMTAVMNPPLPVPEPLMLLLVAYSAWSLELDYIVLRHPRQATLRLGNETLSYAVSLEIS